MPSYSSATSSFLAHRRQYLGLLLMGGRRRATGTSLVTIAGLQGPERALLQSSSFPFIGVPLGRSRHLPSETGISPRQIQKRGLRW